MDICASLRLASAPRSDCRPSAIRGESQGGPCQSCYSRLTPPSASLVFGLPRMHLRPLCLLVGLTGLRAFGFVTDTWLSDQQIHQVTGEPARLERAADHSRPLKIVTWNIEYGQAYKEIASVLRTLDADVILLQEADTGCRRSEYRNVARDLAHDLEMNWVAAGEFQELGEGRRGEPALTGQAILSRYRIDAAGPVRFKAQDRWRWSINPIQPRRGGR